MKRLFLALLNELRLFRTAIPLHLVAVLQPTVMYILMSVILVQPTFDMYITHPYTPVGEALVAAMEEVGSPIGPDYIHPVLVEVDQPLGLRQVITVEEREGQFYAIQRFGLVDSNMVKNFRDRLTAAALRMWNASLGDRAVKIEERPWLPEDMPYTLYFGMAMLPLTAAVAASFVGASTTAQEFEYGTILEYSLSPVSGALAVGARLIRLTLISMLSAAILLAVLWVVNGAWPSSFWKVALILLPVSLAAGCLGIIAGLLLRKSIPAFLIALVTSFVTWLLGSAFGLAAGFNRFYEFISRLTLNTHAVELLFPLYFDVNVGHTWGSILYMLLASGLMIGLTLFLYQRILNHQG